MKYAFLLASVFVACNAIAQAPAPSLSYNDIVRDAAHIGTYEHGSEDALKSSSIGRTVVLDLKPFPKHTGSGAFYVNRTDGIAFTCATKEAGFKGGRVTTTIANHESGEEETHFFELANCKSK